MARHRSGAAPDGSATRHRRPVTPSPSVPDPVPAAEPSAGGSTPGPTAPQRPPGRHRGDPDTTPLDLAAIAKAAASARPASPSAAASVPGPRRPAEAPASLWTPAASVGGDTSSGTRASHRAAGPGGVSRIARGLAPTRAAGALALVGALAGAGVAAAGGSTVLARGETPAGTGELRPPVPTSHAGVATAGSERSTRVVTGRPAAAREPKSTAAPARIAPPEPEKPEPEPEKPEPASPPAVAEPVDDGRTLWSADFATAGLDNFKSTPWNHQGASAPTLSDGLASFLTPGGGKRSEIVPDFEKLSEGDEYYFGFSVRLDENFPVDASGWQVITQFKNEGTGSPPLEVKVKDGKFVLDGDSGGFERVIGEARPGQWTHLALKVEFSSSDGVVSAWQDGVQKLSGFRPPSGTLYEGKSSYVKIGLYRDSSIDRDGRLAFGSWAIGTSLGSVTPGPTAGSGKD